MIPLSSLLYGLLLQNFGFIVYNNTRAGILFEPNRMDLDSVCPFSWDINTVLCKQFPYVLRAYNIYTSTHIHTIIALHYVANSHPPLYRIFSLLLPPGMFISYSVPTPRVQVDSFVIKLPSGKRFRRAGINVLNESLNTWSILLFFLPSRKFVEICSNITQYVVCGKYSRIFLLFVGSGKP